MTDEERIALARRFNELFEAAPFAEVRTALVESESMAEAAERLGGTGIAEFALEHVDPEIEMEVHFPGAEIIAGGNGIQGWFDFWRDWLEPWKDLRTTASNYRMDDGRVLVDIKVEAEGGLSGAPTTIDVFQAWKFEDHKATSYGVYPAGDGA